MDAQEYKKHMSITHTQEHKKSPLAFVYVPKTGGTYLSMRVIPNEYGDRFFSHPARIHMSISKIRSIVGNDTPTFTMMRDPYDRVCSEYFFFKRKAEVFLEHFKWDVSNDEKLKAFVSRIKGISEEMYADKVYNMYKNNMSVEDYLEWSIDNPTYPHYYDIEQPKDFSVVGLTERVEESLALLKNMYDLSAGNGDYNHNEKKSVNKPYETKYSRVAFEKKNFIEYDLYSQGKERFHSLCKQYL